MRILSLLKDIKQISSSDTVVNNRHIYFNEERFCFIVFIYGDLTETKHMLERASDAVVKVLQLVNKTRTWNIPFTRVIQNPFTNLYKMIYE